MNEPLTAEELAAAQEAVELRKVVRAKPLGYEVLEVLLSWDRWYGNEDLNPDPFERLERAIEALRAAVANAIPERLEDE